jgi:4-hydroxy-2-oxoheptanedioate aldolase
MEAIMILENPLKKTLKAGGVVLGTMIGHLRLPAVAVMLKNAGWDFVFVDCEHGSFTQGHLADFCIAARGVNLPTIVRVPSIHEPQRLYQTLDLGATGLLCPQTETQEQVAAIMHATKYYPMGQRGMATRNVHTSWGRYKGSELTARLNQETMIVLQIESKKAVENLEQLLAVPGVDAAFIGPNDLSQTLGIPGDPNHLYLGTTNSWIYESNDEGASWHRLARLDKANDLVIDDIASLPRVLPKIYEQIVRW